MKRLIVVLILILLASASRAEKQAERDKIMGRISDDIFAGREPLLKSCKEEFWHMGAVLRRVKSFAQAEKIKQVLNQSEQPSKECRQELMWYNVYCAERVDVSDGTVTKGVAVNEPACRSYSQRAVACEGVREAFFSALSELRAWQRTYSETAKIRAATFEDKFVAAAKRCAEGQ